MRRSILQTSACMKTRVQSGLTGDILLGKLAACQRPSQAAAPTRRAPFSSGAFQGSNRGRRFNLAAVAAGEPVQGLSGREERGDPFRAAAHRLNNLLSGIGDGSEEYVAKVLEDESAEVKTLLACLSGGIVSGAAALICWFIHRDPLGGASLSYGTLQHAVLGIAAAVPFSAFKLAGWTKEAHAALPTLADIHEKEVQRMQPLLAGMSAQQAAVVSLVEVVSSVLLLFPAFQGGLQLSLQLYSSRLQDLGWQVPDGKSYLVSLIVLAVVSGLGRAADHAPTEEEFEVIGDAVSNADRYYKLIGTSVAQRQEEADQMSAAFKLTAAAWFEQQTVTGAASAAIAALEILFLGALWHWTQDLSTPMAAALLTYGVDFAGMYQKLATKQH